jgi:hypothetical protein
MAITSPVTLSIPLIGDGVTDTLTTALAPLFVAQGVSGATMPVRLISITMSDGSAVSGEIQGQLLVSTFTPAPADMAQIRINVTFGV